jgi:spermidine/putrescine transport system permease protein
MYLPILLVIVYSFNESKSARCGPVFSLRWYRELFADRSMFEALRNSLVLGALSSLCAAVIGTLGAVGMARIRWRGKGAVEYVSTLPIMIPEIILAWYFWCSFRCWAAVWDDHAGDCAFFVFHPYVYMLVKARLVGLDKSCVEAARDLGASEFRAFWDVTLPLVLRRCCRACCWPLR